MWIIPVSIFPIPVQAVRTEIAVIQFLLFRDLVFMEASTSNFIFAVPFRD